MSKEEFLKIQTCILKVNIHCDGCKKKVKKTLQKIDGVYTTTVDAENGKVTVSGNVDPATLIKKLGKAGKHAELLFPKGGGDKKGQQLNSQLEKLLLDAGKGGQKDVGKPQKGGGGGGDDQKIQQPNPLQQLKMFKDLNFPPTKDPKSVKFVLPEEEDGSDFDDEFDDEDDFDDDYDDELDGFDDDFEDDIKDMKAKIINGGGQPVVNEKKGGGGGGNNNNNSAKKGGGGDVNTQNKVVDAKNSSGGKKGGGGSGGGGSGKNGGGGNSPQDGKNGGNNKAARNGNNNNVKDGGEKQSGGKGGAAGAPGGHQMNHQAMMAQMANMNMNMPKGNNPGAAVQGLPARTPPGYFPGGTITPEMIAAANPYQQQYMAAMMQQQQRAMMNGQERGYQPMAYLRPPLVAAYMAPPPEYTHFFSDENTDSCSIM